MLELLDLTQTLQKSEYAAAMPALRAELRDLQRRLQELELERYHQRLRVV